MMRAGIQAVVEGKDLTEAEAMQVMTEIMEGAATPAQIAAFLIGLRVKGESVAEITGCARVMRDKATFIRTPEGSMPVDTAGTGGDGMGTFNISTTSAFVAAGAGVVMAKHGNRAASSQCGSADVLEALGRRRVARTRRRGGGHRRGGHRLSVCPRAARRHAARHRPAPRDRRPNDLQHPRPPDQSGPRAAPVGGRVRRQADPGAGHRAASSRRRARLRGARQRQPGRTDHDRRHDGLGTAQRWGAHLRGAPGRCRLGARPTLRPAGRRCRLQRQPGKAGIGR